MNDMLIRIFFAFSAYFAGNKIFHAKPYNENFLWMSLLRMKLCEKFRMTMFQLLSLFILTIGSGYYTCQASEPKIPPQIRMLRIYGGSNERQPPIVILPTDSPQFQSSFGEAYVTIEIDIDAPIPPSLIAKFVHCNADWSEDENIFLNDIGFLRTSNIDWRTSAPSSYYFSHRGFIKAPNEQVKFKFSGNWKVKIYEMDSQVEPPLCEGRFFVLQPRAECRLDVFGDMYRPKFNVSFSAVAMEATVTAPSSILENQLHTAVFYRNFRWSEPYVTTENPRFIKNEKQYKFKYKAMQGGFASFGKKYRVERIPTENDYRILELTNTAWFPRIGSPVRLPFSDLRRNGSSVDYDDDGAMLTNFVSASTDDYVNIEFIMEPDGWHSDEDVFIAGSFNNWNPDGSWMMSYDEEMRYYHLRHWVRRGKHNYLYGTGRYNFEARSFDNISYDYFEGNAATNAHNYLCFVYYREFDFGGYDALIAVGGGSVYGYIKR
ncbi:MAG: hypothetical protein HW421_4125 [Ignavibacteria bacterium]|nr:hypothetical protein [Ignavibacteria bacterium]